MNTNIGDANWDDEDDPEGDLSDDSPRDDGEVVPALDDALLATLASAQYAYRLDQAILASEARRGRRAGSRSSQHLGRAERFAEALQIVAAKAQAQLTEAYGTKVEELRLTQDNRALLQGRFTTDRTLALLIAAAMGNPIRPFEVEIDDQEQELALEQFATDLGQPRTYAKTVLEAVEKASATPASIGTWIKRGTAVLVGVAMIAAAPYLVAIAAPAGLAGAAALVGGLAALGPGGMLGGLAIVGAVAGTGGTLAGSAFALSSGSRATVQENLTFLEAFIRTKRTLNPSKKSFDEIRILNEMKNELRAQLVQQERLSDKKSAATKEARQKVDDVDRVLKNLNNLGLVNTAPATNCKDTGNHA